MLGAIALAASWAFGSTPSMVVGVGLVLAGVFARLWARRAKGSIDIERRLLPGDRLEGGDVRIVVRVRRTRQLVGGTIALRQRLGSIDEGLRMHGLQAEIAFTGLPRGRHRLGPLEVTLSDPLGLERVEDRFDDGLSVLIRPRIPTLRSLFSNLGARESGAARSTFRRPSGFEIHAIRDYAPGEPLRGVHWPSTARRGRLMVKELDDAPRDDLVVVLDQDPDGCAGPAGSSSFDAAVRAAGALALAHALWGRRVVIVGSSPSFDAVRVSSAGHDWDVALDALASVMPVVGARVVGPLRASAGPLAHAREIIVVTGLPELVVEPLLDLTSRGRSAALVAVAAQTFVGRPRERSQPALLRAVAQGIPVAVVSAESTIEEALAGGLTRSLSA
ncbi:DUF58 domain-containing protein [Gaiella sp.]|uniref:DUF58 domain-containing protein n=1 Tax=Gaiella sp. TaxID=2663207 RepID=UPI0039836438